MSSKIEKLSHYGVLVVALSALVVSILQVQILHNHNKLTVRPLINPSVYQGDSTVTVSIQNAGFGPAIVKDVKYEYEETVYDRFGKVLEAAGEMSNIREMAILNGSVLAPGESKTLVRLQGQTFRSIAVEIRFQSIYEEEGTSRLRF